MQKNNDNLIIKGARTHNLKNISISMPKNKLVVITGLSGSGKSSLAFDTIYAEGQRRYVESLSAYARQFLDRMNKPDVDLIEGLSPAISIEQKSTSHNPRSTVGTVTEVHDYLRLLFARAGDPHCPEHNHKLEAQTISQIVDNILLLGNEKKIVILSPIISEQKGSHKDLIYELRSQGFIRVRLNNSIHEIDDLPEIDKNKKHTIEVVVDRLKIDTSSKQRITESIETAVRLSKSKVIVYDMDNDSTHLFSTKFACPESGFTIEEIEPRLFSFNSPFGACEECEGIGVKLNVDPNLVIPNDKKSIADGAIEPWAKTTTMYYAQTLASLAKHYGFSLEDKWNKIPKKIRDVILYGSDDEEIKFNYDDGYEAYSHKKTFEGVINNLERRYLETDSDWKREEIAQYQSDTKCERCNGHRLVS